jgi:AcrR family transcriptional regulator
MDRDVSSARAAQQLPSGRHGLPRAFVIANQRDRILDAVMIVVSERGYATMRIEDVIATAGVSRRTFYDHFANKEDAFLAAYDLVVRQLTAAVGSAFAAGEAWSSRVSRGLTVFLTLLAGEPALARVCIVEVLAAGPNALARRAIALERFRVFIAPDDDGAARPEVTALTAETVIGGVYEVIYSRVVEHRTHELPSLLPELLHAVLLPFVGADVAAAECARGRARPGVHNDLQQQAATGSNTDTRVGSSSASRRRWAARPADTSAAISWNIAPCSSSKCTSGSCSAPRLRSCSLASNATDARRAFSRRRRSPGLRSASTNSSRASSGRLAMRSSSSWVARRTPSCQLTAAANAARWSARIAAASSS